MVSQQTFVHPASPEAHGKKGSKIIFFRAKEMIYWEGEGDFREGKL